ncbi:Cathepsin_B [Hexamita inflata]|uniref:Cathepsin B n=1 Tax=Hexamita inflata TaxID=28002 RepID=A0AA86Q8K9_9EUKA|nr:Cathepsin B [Hexamita inflata]
MVSCDKNCHGCNSGYLSKNVAFLNSTVTTDKCASYKSGKTNVTGSCLIKCDDDQFDQIKGLQERLFWRGLKTLYKQVLLKLLSLFTIILCSTRTVSTQISCSEGRTRCYFRRIRKESSTEGCVTHGEPAGGKNEFRIVHGKNECNIDHECYLIEV